MTLRLRLNKIVEYHTHIMWSCITERFGKRSMKKNLALIVYIFAIVLLSACAATIIGKLIFWPPCTQTGNICVVDGWSIAGLAASILGVSATVLSILGAVGVAGWWLWLNDRVQALIKKLYEEQKIEVNKNVDDLLKEQQQKIEDKAKQSQTRIEALFDETLDDFEDSIAKSFAAMGPLLAEPVAQRALGTKRFPTLPFYMTEMYLDLIKQEDKLTALEREITTSKEAMARIPLRTRTDIDLSNNAIRTELENDRQSVLRYLNDFKSPSYIVSILEDCRRLLYWWEAAQNNRSRTPSLKPEDFDNVQKKVDLYRTPLEKAEQDFDQLKSGAQSLLSHIEDLLR